MYYYDHQMNNPHSEKKAETWEVFSLGIQPRACGVTMQSYVKDVPALRGLG